MVRSNCLNNFLSQIFINFTGNPLYEEYLGVQYVTVYFILLSSFA